MSQRKLVNSETDKNVDAYLDKVTPQVRKADAKILKKLMSELTGHPPKIWGVSIIGYGKHTYQRKNGEEYAWFNVGFSPGKSRMAIYLMYDVNEEAELLTKLGKHKTGKGCLYFNKLADVDIEALTQLIKKSDRWKR